MYGTVKEEYTMPLAGPETQSLLPDDDDDDSITDAKILNNPALRAEQQQADALSTRLLEIDDEDEDAHDQIVRQSLKLNGRPSGLYREQLDDWSTNVDKQATHKLSVMLWMAGFGLIMLIIAFYVGVQVVGPPNQPVGPYKLVELQQGSDFFGYYTFYEGPDSMGSNGYQYYESLKTALDIGIVNVSIETAPKNVFGLDEETIRNITKMAIQGKSSSSSKIALSANDKHGKSNSDSKHDDRRRLNIGINDSMIIPTETFVYMNTKPTDEGHRSSIRLEGNRRFDRGLFILDVRHMPAGCGVWPAFWLTDEANWPVNGEIDILEGVSYQSMAKTALHTTDECVMNDIPLGTMSGGWDTAQGIPDAKTGVPDMTLRYAQNCFAYDPKQWINQGCVAMDTQGNGTLGVPLNEKGGGIFVHEWDPFYRHMRAWVFTPHHTVPNNLAMALATAHLPASQRVEPDPEQWPLPYGYFAIGTGTNCAASHFKHMRLVFNTAFCGSVASPRFKMDCPVQSKEFETCNDWVKSRPKEMDEAYWKVKGVYVYERSFKKTWIF